MINIFWILVIILAVFFYQRDKRKPLSKAFGSFLIVLGLIIIDPILGSPTDLVAVPLYFSWKGWGIEKFNIPTLMENFWEYTIFSTVVGGALIIFGMALAGIDIKGLKRRFLK